MLDYVHVTGIILKLILSLAYYSTVATGKVFHVAVADRDRWDMTRDVGECLANRGGDIAGL